MGAQHTPSAFPVNAANLGEAGAYPAEPGMDLRDWFAGQAITGLLASGDEAYDLADTDDRAAYAAYRAYTAADALLRVRRELRDAYPAAKPFWESGL